MSFAITADLIGPENAKLNDAPDEDYQALGGPLARRSIAIEKMTERAMAYLVAVPTSGVGNRGLRFACRQPGSAAQTV